METLNYRNYTIALEQDDFCESPNEWGDDEIFLLSKHREFDVERKGFNIDEIFDHIEKTNIWEWEKYRLLPLFAYIHSGISLSTKRVCKWDSSLVGVILISKEFSEEEQDKLVNNLLSNWNTYLIGDVWRFSIFSKDNKLVYSLCGIYGNSEAISEAKSQIDWEVRNDIKNFIKRKKIEIRNRIPLYYRMSFNF